MKTYPQCTPKDGKVVSQFEDGRQLTLEPEEAIKYAHELLACAGEAVKK